MPLGMALARVMLFSQGFQDQVGAAKVKVPKGNLLGKEGKGFQYMMQNFNHERFAFCAMSTRFARVCLEDSLKFAGKRKTFGKTLIQHPIRENNLLLVHASIPVVHIALLEQLHFRGETQSKA